MRDKTHAPDPPGLAPRRAALALLSDVLSEGAMLAEGPATLDAAGRARARRLAADVLRHMGRADAMLATHLGKRPPPAAMNVLRLATVEMCLHGAAAHGVVDGAVRLMRAHRRTAHLAGLANAVLRRVAADAGRWPDLPPDRLPAWLRGPLVRAWGCPGVAAIEAAHAAAPPLDLTLRDPAQAAEMAAALAATPLPTGSLRRDSPGQVSGLPGYAEGAWWVQDAAAAIPARCLGDVAGRAVLDLCAAPGGKTLQLAAAGARVTALDLSGARLSRLRDNLARCGLSAALVQADVLAWEPEEPAAAILLDAPCSATGTIRRHPELPHIGARRDLAELTALQSAMIDRAAGWLAPGGRLVFCTCSLLPEEGEAQLAGALARHPALAAVRLDPAGLGLPEEAAAAGTGALRLRPDFWPERGGMDGFFIAALERRA